MRLSSIFATTARVVQTTPAPDERHRKAIPVNNPAPSVALQLTQSAASGSIEALVIAARLAGAL